MKKNGKILLLFLAAFFLSSCATRPDFTENETGRCWNISSAAEELSGDDPIEPFNRSMFAVNHFLMRWLVRPVSWVYCSILPGEVIDRIDNVSDNLAFPGRMVSCLCQAKWKGAGISLTRFLLNSTVGIAGIFDPADYYFSLRRRHENMGHAFASWGIGPGCVLILPFSGAVNVRDQVGGLFDSLLDLKIVIPYAGSISGVNRTINSYDSFYPLVESAADPYEQFKTAMVMMRYPQLRDFQFTPQPIDQSLWNRKNPVVPESQIIRTAHYYSPEHPLVDSLRSSAFSMQRTGSRWWSSTSLWNRDFYNLGTVRAIHDPEEPEGTEPRRYQFWNEKQVEGGVPRKKDLIFLIPGVGTHYTGKMVRALAELFSDGGYAVVATSSTMNWSFATTKDSAFPGYPPDDVRRLRRYIKLILEDLEKNESFKPERILVAGYSLGALQTLHLAAQEEENNTLGVSRYIALNPPVDLIFAMEQFEKFGGVLERWTKKEFFENLGGALVSYLPLAQGKYPFQEAMELREAKDMPRKSIYSPNVGSHQAAGMFFLSYRMVLRELLLSNARNGFLSAERFPYEWGRRLPLYQTIDSISGKMYLEDFILPQHPGMTLEQLQHRSSLYSIARFLETSPSVRVIHNLDDPLISEKDALFLSSTLGKKLIWFDHGAHMGNFYLKEFHKQLLGTVDLSVD